VRIIPYTFRTILSTAAPRRSRWLPVLPPAVTSPVGAITAFPNQGMPEIGLVLLRSL